MYTEITRQRFQHLMSKFKDFTSPLVEYYSQQTRRFRSQLKNKKKLVRMEQMIFT